MDRQDLASLSGGVEEVTQQITSRFRSGITQSLLTQSTLVLLNPLAIQNGNELKEFAERIYTLIKGTTESQSVILSGLSGSGKTTVQNKLISALLPLASVSPTLLAQFSAIQILYNSFSTAKTSTNPTASRSTTYTEIHFDQNKIISGGKIISVGLDRSRVKKIGRDERTFAIFYQLLAGATEEERIALKLLPGFGDYELFASSGCYTLPQGLFSNDSIAFGEVREAFMVLGFKPRHVSSILRFLSAILLLGNIRFDNDGDRDFASDSAYIVNRDVLEQVAELLGLDPEELERGLTNRVQWIRKEMVSVILRADGAEKQRDELVESLYAILFAFVGETANHRLCPAEDAIRAEQSRGGSSLILLDAPGFLGTSGAGDRRSTAGALVETKVNGFDEFSFNYVNELVTFFVNEQNAVGSTNSTTNLIHAAKEDGIKQVGGPTAQQNAQAEAIEETLSAVATGRIELLRGGRIGGKADRKPGGILGGMAKTIGAVRKGLVGGGDEEGDKELARGMKEHFENHPAFATAARASPTSFAIAHFASATPITYSTSSFITSDLALLDPEFVALFRDSTDNFVAKLFAGPGFAAEAHPLEGTIIVSAQVSGMPLRTPAPIVPTAHSIARGLPVLDPSERLLDPAEIHPLSSQLNSTVAGMLNLIERTKIWQIICLRPNDSLHAGMLDKRRLTEQVALWRIVDLSKRAKGEWFAGIAYEKFIDRYNVSIDGRGGHGGGAMTGGEGVTRFMRELGIDGAQDSALGRDSLWVSFRALKVLEDHLNPPVEEERGPYNTRALGAPFNASRSTMGGEWGDLGSGQMADSSVDDLLQYGNTHQPTSPTSPNPFLSPDRAAGGRGGNNRSSYRHSTMGVPAPYISATSAPSEVWDSDVKSPLSPSFPNQKETLLPPHSSYSKELAALQQSDREALAALEASGKGMHVESVPTSKGRIFWVIIVWACTWWIPTFMLTYVGRMKRPDVRMAWREKVTLCILIGFFCGTVVFYIVIFGKLICPGFDKANNAAQVSFHQGTNDYWVSVRGNVYDLTNFYRLQHSDIVAMPVVTTDMLQVAGKDLSPYFPIPLTLACPSLVSDPTLALRYTNFTAEVPTAVHVSGSQQADTGSVMRNPDWYTSTFLPKMRGYYKGPLVIAPKDIRSEAEGAGRKWAIYQNGVYDLTDYYNTITLLPTYTSYAFLDKSIANLWEQQAGQDLTATIDALNIDRNTRIINMQCIKNLFYVGETDFRLTPKCQVQPYLLLTFSIILVTTILAKFLAALQLGTKKNPELRDKFVICQVPCYTEGEESLKKTIDSLATLTYDDKRKLLLIICDGMIIGSGNDRPTPRIVLDIFGVDQTIDPDPLMFKSVGEGSKQLNYGKVWSGLYEVDGHVVPYVVVAKCGRPSERSRPGNRGKRDSQILAMRFLNRVHFDSEMYPLELEMYHQIKNVIGVDPQLYEYMLVIDADTSVATDSLNRLVSCTADDSRIIGICGETKLENEKASWWTMIQVYEYFISHHMSKAFESLFGSVTCLPGCFTMYRLRSADKGKPLLVSSLIIDEYSECNLDTLHKKNLLSLGEDRYLTTLILKHFPHYTTKFTPDAQAMTVAPDRWSILLSQRRRWINSTVHNLAELMFLPDMCGFCCFGMRFIVVIDLVGTLILPATFCYLVYLIVSVSTGTAAVPLISLIMLAAVYGFQALIFLLKRQWQFIGWLVIYILAYPIYSFILPLYSFWCFDDFTWGNTRIVVGEGKSKKVFSNDDEIFDERVIPMKKFSDYQVAMLEEDDRESLHSLESKNNGSMSGFSLATRLPPMTGGGGSYHGGTDFYRDTTHNRSSTAFPPPAASYLGGGTQAGSIHGGSVRGGGSEFGYGGGAPGIQSRGSFMGGISQQPSSLGLNSHPSMMSMNAPTSFMPRPDSMMSFNQFGSYGGGLPRPQSSFSVNPFMSSSPTTLNISQSDSPTDEEVVGTLRTYLAHQDLMTVTKRTARDGLQSLFPNADLGPRKDFINASVDGILQGRL